MQPRYTYLSGACSNGSDQKKTAQVRAVAHDKAIKDLTRIKFYSQNGENVIIHEISNERRDGFFVEVGYIDERRFSSTLAFEEAGWMGLCAEPHPGYISLLKQNRPQSIVSYCAAGEDDMDEVTFYTNSRGSLLKIGRAQIKKTEKTFLLAGERQQATAERPVSIRNFE